MRWRVLWWLILSGLILGGCGLQDRTSQALRLRRSESIQEAIDRAQPGETIVLSSGVWQENLRIQKPLILKGSGLETTVLKAARPGPPVIWVLGEATVVIEDLTIAEGRGGHISSAAPSSGVLIEESASVTLRHVQIKNNAASGVFVCESARVSLENCALAQNDRYGVELVDQGQAVLHGSQIVQNKMGGVWLSGLSRYDGEDTEINANRGHGIWARDGSFARLFASRLVGNEKTGLYLQDESSAVLLGSHIGSHQEAGVYVVDRASLSAYGTTWEENWLGLGLGGREAYLEGCVFRFSRWDAIQAQTGYLEMRYCRLYGGRGVGLSTTGVAEAWLWNCEISGFSVAGISGFANHPVQGEGNELRQNGVALLGNVNSPVRKPLAQARFSSRDLSGSVSDLQEIVDSLLPGGVLDVGPGWYTAGITVDKPLEIRGEGAVLQGKPETPVISVVSGGKLVLSGLHITGGSEGLALASDAQATLQDCYLWENGAGIKLWHSAKLQAQRLSVSYHPQGGLWLWNQSQAELAQSTFYANVMCGISAADKSRLVLRNSTVMDNGWQGGLVLRGQAQVEVYDSFFVNNRGYGIAVQDRYCVGSGPGFFGIIKGVGNVFERNYKGSTCPESLVLNLGG